MILTCPNCAARFMIDARALGEAGRTVRCGACGHSWLQLPEPTEATEHAEHADHGDRPLDFAGVMATPPSEHAPAHPAESAPPAAEAPAPEGAPPPPPILKSEGPRRAEAAALAAARAPSPRRTVVRVIVWLVFAFVVAGLLFGGYRYRNDIVRVWPPAMKVYELLAIDTEPPTGIGLRVPQDSLRFRRDSEGGIPILIVSGEILNTSTRPERITPMRILLLDKDSRVLRTERVKIEDRTLDPGKRLPFQASIPNAPPEAAAVRITFDITGG